jgi:hypothetical protein
MKKGELTPTMQQAVEFIRQHGSIVRYQGGYWNRPGCVHYGEYSAGSFGSSTIDGMAKRGIIEYTEWKERGTGYKFPIAAKLKESTTVNSP